MVRLEKLKIQLCFCVIIWRQNFLRSTFLLFSWLKRGTVRKNCSYFKGTRTRTHHPLNCERLPLEHMQTRVY